MNNKPDREKSERLTTEEVEAALHAALRDEGRLFTASDEDIAELEESLDLTAIPTPDVNGFMAKLRAQRQDKIIRLPRPEEAQAVSDNLAEAARNGKSISDEMRRKMAELRDQYEDPNHKTEDGNR